MGDGGKGQNLHHRILRNIALFNAPLFPHIFPKDLVRYFLELGKFIDVDGRRVHRADADDLVWEKRRIHHGNLATETVPNEDGFFDSFVLQ